MNQFNQSGSSLKSASAFTSTKPSSPTYNGYARFQKISTPTSIASEVVLPPHMRSPSYVAAHASKPDTDTKQIALNDLEEGVKLTLLADIERDQRMNQVKDLIEKTFERSVVKQSELDNKRKMDHRAFDDYVKTSKIEKAQLQEQYNELFECHTKLQAKHINLQNEHTDLQLDLNTGTYLNTSLQTLVDMKQMEIDDLKQTLALYKPSSPININALVEIMDQPDLDLKMNADDVNDQSSEDQDFTHEPNPLIPLDQGDAPIIRTYTKKPIKLVTDPTVLRALNYMAENVDDYVRNTFKGVDIKGVRYAFYYGKINTSGAIGILSTVVLSSDKKVYNIKSIANPVEMNWNQDKDKKGKRGYGHLYLGALTNNKGFEVYLQNVFQTELGIFI